MGEQAMAHCFAGNDGDMPLSALIAVSLLLHGLLVYALPEMRHPKQTSVIEVTLEEIAPPVRRENPAPLEQDKKTAQQVLKLKAPPQIIQENKPAPVVKPRRETEPPPENTRPQERETLLEPAVKPVSAPEPKPAAMVREETESSAPPPVMQEATPSLPATPSIPALKEPPARSVHDTQAIDSYLAAIRARIERNKRYPVVARRRGQEGEVVLRFILAVTGEVLKVEVLKSSGVASLDRAAVNAVHRAMPFAEPPEGLVAETLPMELTIVFRLR